LFCDSSYFAVHRHQQETHSFEEKLTVQSTEKHHLVPFRGFCAQWSGTMQEVHMLDLIEASLGLDLMVSFQGWF